jgi:ABC-type glycerol-3-phosphate transport system permease component
MTLGPFGKWVARVGCAVLVLSYGIPLLWIVLTSFKSEAELGQSLISLNFSPTVAAYSGIGSIIVQPIIHSVEISGGTVLVILVMSVLTGYGLTHIRGRTARWVISGSLGLLVVLQLVPQPTAVIPMYGVLASWHLINSIPGLIFADAALQLPLAVLLLRPFFLNIPRELEEAALVDGASMLQVLRKVVMPLITNGMITVAVMMFAITWGEFIYASTFLNSSGLLPVSVVLLDQVGNLVANWNQLMALAVVTSLPLLVLFVVSRRRLREGLMVGAIR